MTTETTGRPPHKYDKEGKLFATSLLAIVILVVVLTGIWIVGHMSRWAWSAA